MVKIYRILPIKNPGYANVRNTNRKSYLAGETQPPACCCDNRKCPKSPLATTDFGPRYGDVAITRIRVLYVFSNCRLAHADYYNFYFHNDDDDDDDRAAGGDWTANHADNDHDVCNDYKLRVVVAPSHESRFVVLLSRE